MIGGYVGFLLALLPFLHIYVESLIALGFTVFLAWLVFTPFWYIPLLLAAWWVYDRDTPNKQGRRWLILRKVFVWKYLANYFPITLHKTADLDPSKNYLFACHPHSLAPVSALLNFSTSATGFDELFPKITVHTGLMNWHFTLPIHREYLMGYGFCSVSAPSIDYKLSQIGPGHSVLILIGGKAETMLVDHSKYVLKLKDRKGFIRRALKTGACVVPVFSFNEIRNFDVTYLRESSSRMFKVFQYFFKGDMPQGMKGRPGFGPFMPKQVKIDTIVGAPIDFCAMKSFGKGQEPPDELVDECHNIYLEQLRQLYDTHKVQYGDENAPLIFV